MISKLNMMLNSVKETNSWQYVDFDVSMKTSSFPGATMGQQHVLGYDDTEFLSFCRERYENFNPSKIEYSENPLIPKIVHQIWLGSAFPAAFESYAASWISRHRDRGWRYILWVDHEVNHHRGNLLAKNYRELEDILRSTPGGPIECVVADIRGCEIHNQAYYDSVSNYGMRSDILKWEVVNRFGGAYVDTDFECLKPVDELHHRYDLYTALQPLDTMYVQLGAGMLAAAPDHPVLRHCVEAINDSWGLKGAPKKTGPIHFSKSFFANAGRDGKRDIAFPAHYFYPLGCKQSWLRRRKWLQQGAYAVHHWSKSWMPKSYRPVRFRTIDNDESAESWND